MDDRNELSNKIRTGAELESIRLSSSFSDLPVEAGEAIAQLQIEAMEKAYENRFADGVAKFSTSKITTMPVELGEAVADIRLDGMRAALFGFCWRWALIGGFSASAVLFFGFSFGVAAIALAASVPVSCVLVLI
jgi:hypothetical protein